MRDDKQNLNTDGNRYHAQNTPLYKAFLTKQMQSAHGVPFCFLAVS